MRFIETDSVGLGMAGIRSMTFPGGEPHIKLDKEIKNEDIFITARVMSWDEWGVLLALLEALSFPGAHNQLHLFIPYFPGARQDKPEDHLSPLTCQMYAQTLARYPIEDLIVFDIHSEKAGNLILDAARCGTMHYVMPHDVYQHRPFGNVFDAIVIPDKGARSRALHFGDNLYPGLPFLFCDKEREPETGYLSNYRIINEVDPSWFNFLIIDDICDGGGTFNLLAEALKEKVRDPRLTLFVSHGIFSKGIDNLDPQYTRVYTTDSLHTRTSRKLESSRDFPCLVNKQRLLPHEIWQLIHARKNAPVSSDPHRFARWV